MKKIKLTQNQFALVDDEDFDRVNQYRWCANYFPRIKSFVARRSIRNNGKETAQYMSRFILNAKPKEIVDHKNHDTLDNRKENLRLCNTAENLRNRKRFKNNKSGYKGVVYKKKADRWMAQIAINGVKIDGPYRKTAIEAAKDYNKFAKKMFGEYAYLNEIPPIKV